MAIVLESSQLAFSIAVVAALLGFVVGVGARAFLPIPKNKPRIHQLLHQHDDEFERSADHDRERFFRFTWLVLDVLPCYLRVHFKLLWDAKYAPHTLPAWSDSPSDGDAFWNGVYHDEPFTTLSMTQGEWTTSPTDEHSYDRLSPRRKFKVAGREYRVVSQSKSKKNSKPFLHLNQPVASTGSFQVFDQRVLCESNCDSRNQKLYGSKVVLGDCDLWDISLVCFAMLHSSHNLLTDSTSRSHVEAVRNLRNNKLAHIKSCRMGKTELIDAISTMDLYVSSNLPKSLLDEWCHASRQVLDEVVSVPKQMPSAGVIDVIKIQQIQTDDNARWQKPELLQLEFSEQPRQQFQSPHQQQQQTTQQQTTQQRTIQQTQQTQQTQQLSQTIPLLPGQLCSNSRPADDPQQQQQQLQLQQPNPQQESTSEQQTSQQSTTQKPMASVCTSRDSPARSQAPVAYQQAYVRASGYAQQQQTLCGKDVGLIQQLQVPVYSCERQSEAINRTRWFQELGLDDRESESCILPIAAMAVVAVSDDDHTYVNDDIV